MPWKVTEPMYERAKFVALLDEGLFSMSELCQRFGISRRTGYKWLARFEQDGLDSLRDQSRKPQSSPKQTCPAARQALLRVRQDHPTWGPKKLLAYLQLTFPAFGGQRVKHRPTIDPLP